MKKKPVSTPPLQKLKTKLTIQIILVRLTTSFPKLDQTNFKLKILHVVLCKGNLVADI